MTEAKRVLGCIAKPRTLPIFPNTSPLISQLFEGTGGHGEGLPLPMSG